MYVMTDKNGITVRRFVKSEIEEIYNAIKDDEDWEDAEIKWIPTTAVGFIEYIFSCFNEKKKGVFSFIDGSLLTVSCYTPGDSDGIVIVELMDGSVRINCSVSEIQPHVLNDNVVWFGKTRIDVGDLEVVE